MLDYKNSHKLKILIIDDDVTIRLLMNDCLTDEIYTIDETSNGEDALSHISISQPDLVLLDVNMPGMNGFEVCAKIREKYDETEISIIMVTGLEDSQSIEQAYASGATDFIAKPINWNTFPYRIQYLLRANSAIKAVSQREFHLYHMERISRAITQNNNKDIMLKEALTVMLDIFTADRAFIVKPDNAVNNFLVISSETSINNVKNISDITDVLLDDLDTFTLHRAEHSESPILTQFNSKKSAPIYDLTLKQQIIKSLHLHDNQTWHLIIQHTNKDVNWAHSEIETFNKIGIRLSGVLTRYLATDELHQKEILLKQLQKIGHLGNWHWDALSNEFSWSQEMFTIYENNPSEYIPDFNTFYEIAFDEDNQRQEQYNLILNRSIDSYQVEHRILTSNKDIKWISEHCGAKFDRRGNLLEINGVIQDITNEHIQKEQEVHNNKMDAIGQLTSGIAHDFGNFMTVAGGNMKLLQESIKKYKNFDVEITELIEDSNSAIEDSIELTKQLLAFSRKKSIAPVYVDIKKSLQKFKKLFKNTVGKKISLSFNIGKDLPSILVDPTQFESSLLNLIINARNALPNGGKVAISAEMMVTRRPLEIVRNMNNSLGKNCVCVYVKDNGVGMTDDIIERSIEPFYTTQENTGTGLGLSMVYGFITQSSGELVIHSQIGKGTTIYMQFPILNSQTSQHENIKQISDFTNKNTTILIVEDQQNVRRFAARCLDLPGIDILEAEDAKSARELISSNKIDLLFTDILMPGDMNGHELAEWVSHSYPSIKILLTTAMENIQSHKQISTNNDYRLLPKPYSKQELTENIYHYI